ncbi:MAG: CRISPR-associated protein Cas4 [Gemmataceae bacterium]
MIPLPQLADKGEEYPTLSALNDLLFCARRCYLHRVEGVWIENAHTLSGSRDHRIVHVANDTNPHSVRTVRGLRLISHTLKIQGVADMVEFPNDVPFPVEYKRGKRRKWDNDEVQLCAQAICLEEMLGVAIPAGAIFHVKSKRRRDVPFTNVLRLQTRRATERLHELFKQSISPPPILQKKCKECSLYSMCLPELLVAPKAYRDLGKALYVTPAT